MGVAEKEKEQTSEELRSVSEVEQQLDETVVPKALGFDYYHEAQEIPEEEVSREFPKIRRKIDTRLLPLLFITYTLQFLDKLSLNYANAYSFSEDLDLVGQRYSWVAAIFNFGYLAGSLPANYLLQKLPVGKYTGVALFTWAILLIGHIGAKNYAGILVLRFLLGVLEACISPNCMNLCRLFYHRDDQHFRQFTFLSANGISTVVGALLGFGLGHATHAAIKPWKLIFLVIGLMNLVWSAVFLYVCPDGPTTAKFLNEREKHVLISVISKNSQGIQEKKFKWYQAKECVSDIAVWLMILIGLGCGVINGGVSNFSSALIKGYGFSGLTATALQLPTGAIEFFVVFGFGCLSLFVRNTRSVALFFGSAIPLGGLIGLKLTPIDEKWTLVGCTWLQYIVGLPVIATWTFMVANVAGSSKKTVANGLWFVFYAAGNIIGANIFFAREAPKYESAITALIVCYSVMIGLTFLNFWVLYSRNKRTDKLYGNSEKVQEQAILNGYKDMTDFENEGFKYGY